MPTLKLTNENDYLHKNLKIKSSRTIELINKTLF